MGFLSFNNTCRGSLGFSVEDHDNNYNSQENDDTNEDQGY